MKKYILLFIIIFVSPIYSLNYYNYNIDKCCLVNLTEYKTEFSKVENSLKSRFPRKKKYLDSVIFKITGIVWRRYRGKQEYVYKKLAFKISDYIYNHNIQKGTESYYKLSYLAFTFYDYYLYYKNQNKNSSLDNLIDKVIGN